MTVTKSHKTDPLSLLIKESDAYTQLDQIEKYVEQSGDLSVLPVQPVYLALKKLPIEKVAEYLPKFSKEQREVFLDIDLWNKDEIDIENFSFWLDAYSIVDSDDVRRDFVTSEQFLIYLKSKFNIWSFDAEDPNYPDHDNYFLTDDSLLLFEFDENYSYVDQVRNLVRQLYYEIGVENAYTFLFKLVSDSYLILQEEEFSARKERMRDFGFVDYMDALEVENPFINIDFLNLFIKNKKSATGSLDQLSKNQNLHNSSLVAFKDHFKKVIDELLKVSDQKRTDFLQFNFVRLINARLEHKSALKKGSVAMTRTGAQTKNLVLLGFNYIQSDFVNENFKPSYDLEQGLFSIFDFTELYRIGNSLIKFNLKDLKKALTLNGFEGDKENFLGDIWIDFLDNTFDEPVKFHIPKKEKADAIIEIDEYNLWMYKSRTLKELLPFAKKFYETFQNLKNEGKLQDTFYLNYTVDSIDLEAILLSSFANYFLGSFDEKNISKLGLTIDEYRKFAKKIISSEGKFILTPELFKKLYDFSNNFGLSNVFDFNSYMQELLKAHLEGYEFDTMEEEDFKHVGGPIILTIMKH